MHGLLTLNKPAGWSSRDAVNRVQRLVRPAKAGHAGTLDPLATGVLVVCIGHATRLIEYVQRMPKQYGATFRLGCTSPSDDTETLVTDLTEASPPSRSEIEAALPRFTGTVEQLPPPFSALKIDGQRAYKLARRGAEVELAPRSIEIHDLAVVGYEYPNLELHICCSSGTYVRALGRDLAAALHTGAVMTALVRTAIGPFSIANALDPDGLTPASLPTQIQPSLTAVAELPRWRLTDAERVEVAHARPIPLSADAARITPTPAEFAALDAGDELVAILKPIAGGLWKPSPNFS